MDLIAEVFECRAAVTQHNWRVVVGQLTLGLRVAVETSIGIKYKLLLRSHNSGIFAGRQTTSNEAATMFSFVALTTD